MNISILCSSKEHPIYGYLNSWQQKYKFTHKIELVQSKQDLSGGDILFLISCSELINQHVRDSYKATLVIHASNLPLGRGWSPHIWQLLEDKKEIFVTMLEAEDKVDSGAIWAQRILRFEGHELYDEINDKLFALETELMDLAVANFNNISPEPQRAIEPTFYRKRTPEDSRIDPDKSITEQFNLLRVSDPERFPAFFELFGYRYRIKIEKVRPTE